MTLITLLLVVAAFVIVVLSSRSHTLVCRSGLTTSVDPRAGTFLIECTRPNHTVQRVEVRARNARIAGRDMRVHPRQECELDLDRIAPGVFVVVIGREITPGIIEARTVSLAGSVR
jgi:hypothetical protein